MERELEPVYRRPVEFEMMEGELEPVYRRPVEFEMMEGELQPVYRRPVEFKMMSQTDKLNGKINPLTLPPPLLHTPPYTSTTHAGLPHSKESTNN